MAQARVKVGFFRVEMPPNSGETFAAILTRLSQCARSRGPVLEIDGVSTLTYAVGADGDKLRGDTAKVRNAEFPAVLAHDGEMTDLVIPADKDLAECAAFSYSGRLAVIAMQSNHFGVSASRLARYLSQWAATPGPIVFEPLLRRNAWADLAHFGEIRAVEFGLAPLDTNEPLDDGRLGVSSVVAKSAELDAPQIEVRLSMGHRPGGFQMRRARDFLAALRLVRNRATKLRVWGRDGEDRVTMIDLLKLQLNHSERVEYEPGIGRRVPLDLRMFAVQAAWAAKGADIPRLLADQE